MSCLNLSDINVAVLAQTYGEVMASMILDAHSVKSDVIKFPTPQEAADLYQQIKQKVAGSSFSISNPLTSVNVIENVLMNPSIVSSSNYSPEAYKSKIKTGILTNSDNTNYIYNVAGKTYKVPKTSSEEVINKKVEEIYNDINEWDTTLKEKWVNFITEGDFTKGTAYFGPNQRGESLFNKDIIERATSIIDFSKEAGDQIMLLSQVQEKFPDIIIDADIIGKDPIVVVHKTEDSQFIELSIFDVTGKTLNPNKTTLLFDRFMSTNKLVQNGISTLTASEKGIRDFNLMLMAMSMRNANSKIRFRKLSTMQIAQSKLDVGKDIEMTPSGILAEMETFLKTDSGKEFLDKIPEKFKKLLSDKKLLKLDYGQSYLWLLKNHFRANSIRQDIPHWDESNLTNLADKLGNFLAGGDNLLSVVDLLKERSKQINKIPDSKKNEYQKREAYMLAKGIQEITSPKVTEHSTVRDMTKVGVFTETPQNVGIDAVQNLIAVRARAGKKIVRSMVEFMAVHDPLFNNTINTVWNNENQGNRFLDATTDTSNAKFKRLRRYVEVRDQDGTKSLVKSMMIHYNINDPETQKAMKEDGLTKEEVEYGKFIVETIKETFIKGLIHDRITNRNFDFTDAYTPHGQAKLRDLAIDDYKNLWVDGMIPLMQKTVAAKLFSGDFKGSFFKMMTELQNANAVLEQTHNAEDEKSIENKFMYQLGSEVTADGGPGMNLGSLNNAQRMGIEYDPISKSWTLKDKAKNDDISDDLEMITKYLMLSTLRKIEYDNNVIPAINDTRTILREEKLPNADLWLGHYVDRVVFNKSPKTGINFDIGIHNVSVDAILSAAMKGSTLATMTFNLPVGITSLAVNSFNTIAMGIAQKLAGSHLYGIGELQLAMEEMIKNPRKCEAIMQKYGITEMSERDVIENRKHQKARRMIWQSKLFNFFNYASDYYGRMHVMTAQMIKDGTWEAEVYDEKTGLCTYDETKDARLYKKGVLTPEGKAIKKGIRSGLLLDGSMTEADTKLNYAYDHKSSKILADVGNQVIMAMQPDEASNLGNFWLGRLFLQYKKYLETKAGQMYTRPYQRHESGQWTAVKNEETGELEPQFKPEYFEGKYQTLTLAIKELATLKQKPSEFWVNLQPRQKANIYKLCIDVLLATALFAMYNMADFDDDDEYTYKGRAVPMMRFKRIWQNTYKDLVNDMSPGFYIQTFKNPIALVSIVESYGSAAVALMSADFKKAYKVAPLPLKSTVQLLNQE